MELYPIHRPTFFEPDGYFIIEEVSYPSMCAEFEMGPSEDDPFPEFFGVGVTVAKVDIHENKCHKVGAKEMRECYKFIHGRRERIAYWRTMRYLEYKENAKGQP